MTLFAFSSFSFSAAFSPLSKEKKRQKKTCPLQTVPFRVYYRQTWIGTGSGCLPLQASRGRCEAARGACVRSPGSGDVNQSSGLRQALRYRGIRAARPSAAQGGWYRGRSGLSPRIGAEDFLFSINSWRNVCTTKYRRI